MTYLIVGLGNIGSEYAGTRHNIGFDVVDALAEKHNCAFDLKRLGYKSEFRFKGRSFHLIKPTTYMNLSGKSLRYWMQLLKVKQENVLVIVDDKDLDFGKLRLKGKGNDGGHNGLKDITKQLGNNKYARLRFGIGSNFRPGQQVRYVLGKWTEGEAAEIPNHIDRAVQAIESFVTIGLARTMNQFN